MSSARRLFASSSCSIFNRFCLSLILLSLIGVLRSFCCPIGSRNISLNCPARSGVKRNFVTSLCLKRDDVAAFAGDDRLDVCRPSVESRTLLRFVSVFVVSPDQLLRQMVEAGFGNMWRDA